MCKYGKSDGIFGIFALEMKRRGMDYNLIDGASYGLSNIVVEMEPKGNGRKRAIYFKSANGRECESSKERHWDFGFSQKEVGGLVSLSENYEFQLGLFCRDPAGSGSDFVLVEHESAFECLGVGVHARGEVHVNVIQEPRKHGFGVYGTGTGRERVTRVPRDGIEEL